MLRHQPADNQENALVIKLGGSLIARIPDLVPVLRRSARPALIVPGGGIFADAIRGLGVRDETAAHWMAIAAMDQFGWLVASHGLPVSDILQTPAEPTVFLPYRCLRKEDPLPHSWDVTSDTIAAWVAGSLGLDLLILKSVDGIISDGKLRENVHDRVTTETVDPRFLDYLLEHGIHTTIINGSLPERVEKFLCREPVPGTVIGTTF